MPSRRWTDRAACLLAHHGMIAVGPSLAKAMWLAVEVEALARQYHGCLQIGTPPLLVEGRDRQRAQSGSPDYGPACRMKRLRQLCSNNLASRSRVIAKTFCRSLAYSVAVSFRKRRRNSKKMPSLVCIRTAMMKGNPNFCSIGGVEIRDLRHLVLSIAH